MLVCHQFSPTAVVELCHYCTRSCSCSSSLRRDLAPKDPNGYADSYAKLVFKNQKSATKVSNLNNVPEHFTTTPYCPQPHTYTVVQYYIRRSDLTCVYTPSPRTVNCPMQ